MASYTAEINSAYDDIKAAGTAIELHISVKEGVAGVALEPWKGYGPATGISSCQNTYGLWVNLTSREAALSRVDETSRVILIPAKDLDPGPSTQMLLVADGITYSVVSILKSIDFNGQPILHRVLVNE